MGPKHTWGYSRRRLDFLKVVRIVFWSDVVGPSFRSLARSRFALTVALRAQKLDLSASLVADVMLEMCVLYFILILT